MSYLADFIFCMEKAKTECYHKVNKIICAVFRRYDCKIADAGIRKSGESPEQ